MSENITQEEKINFIYENIKKQENRRKWALIGKWGFRIFIVMYIIYFIKIGLPLFIDSLMPSMPSFGGEEGSSINTDQIKNVLGDYFSK